MKRHKFLSKPVAGLAALLLALVLHTGVLGTQAYAAKLYKWVDKDGNISYQDQPPPEDGKLLKEDELKAPAPARPSTTGNVTPLLVYTVDSCPACDSLITSLDEMGVPVENRSLNDNQEAQRKILEESGGVTVPTIFIGDEVITDTDIDKLSAKLKEAGYVLTEDKTTAEQVPSAEVADEAEQ